MKILFSFLMLLVMLGCQQPNDIYTQLDTPTDMSVGMFETVPTKAYSLEDEVTVVVTVKSQPVQHVSHLEDHFIIKHLGGVNDTTFYPCDFTVNYKQTKGDVVSFSLKSSCWDEKTVTIDAYSKDESIYYEHRKWVCEDTQLYEIQL